MNGSITPSPSPPTPNLNPNQQTRPRWVRRRPVRPRPAPARRRLWRRRGLRRSPPTAAGRRDADGVPGLLYCFVGLNVGMVFVVYLVVFETLYVCRVLSGGGGAASVCPRFHPFLSHTHTPTNDNKTGDRDGPPALGVVAGPQGPHAQSRCVQIAYKRGRGSSSGCDVFRRSH